MKEVDKISNSRDAIYSINWSKVKYIPSIIVSNLVTLEAISVFRFASFTF